MFHLTSSIYTSLISVVLCMYCCAASSFGLHTVTIALWRILISCCLSSPKKIQGINPNPCALNVIARGLLITSSVSDSFSKRAITSSPPIILMETTSPCVKPLSIHILVLVYNCCCHRKDSGNCFGAGHSN